MAHELNEKQKRMIAQEAYDRGHSAGVSEVEAYEREITAWVIELLEAGDA